MIYHISNISPSNALPLFQNEIFRAKSFSWNRWGWVEWKWTCRLNTFLYDRMLLHENSFKALANEDTLLRTHCCLHKCFPVCPHAQHLLRTQILCPEQEKCFWFCSETFCVRTKCFSVCAAQETLWATMCPQQCVLVCQYLYYDCGQISLLSSLWISGASYALVCLFVFFLRSLRLSYFFLSDVS